MGKRVFRGQRDDERGGPVPCGRHEVRNSGGVVGPVLFDKDKVLQAESHVGGISSGDTTLPCILSADSRIDGHYGFQCRFHNRNARDIYSVVVFHVPQKEDEHLHGLRSVACHVRAWIYEPGRKFGLFTG